MGASNPEPCEEVITTPLSDMGTVIPILACNCIPVFADVDPNTGIITAETIAKKITPRTRGDPRAPLRPARRTAADCRAFALARHRTHRRCARRHAAEYAGKKVGTFGEFGLFQPATVETDYLRRRRHHARQPAPIRRAYPILSRQRLGAQHRTNHRLLGDELPYDGTARGGGAGANAENCRA